MSLSPGAQLGAYQVLSLLGAGGMGEVYKARDTRLDRTVAIKVMPADVAADPQVRARFEREARAISQLQHPHICTLYDVGEADGIAFLVMELLQGQSLADRLKKGALPLDAALKIAIDVADALSAAHKQGIVHRDLKPANIMLTKSGAKLLDFGLAKATAPVVTIGISSTQETASTHLTGSGTILGTLHYMSPEQVEGREADARSDIWALGCVLYEMVTGQQAFAGDSAAQVLSGIVAASPGVIPLSPVGLSVLVNDVVQRCLAKDAGSRWQDVLDLSHQLQVLARLHTEPLDGVAGRMAARRGMRPAWALSGAVLLIGISLGAGWLLGSSLTAARTPASVSRLTIGGDATAPISPFGLDYDVAVAADGSFVVYRAGGFGQLVLRRLDRLDTALMPGVAHARQPTISPDGRWVAYFENATTLKKVAVAGGAPILLAQLPGTPRGATWIDNDNLIIATSNGSVGLLRVPAAGGQPTVLTQLTNGVLGHWWPSALPGGKSVLFTIAAPQLGDAQVALLDLTSGEIRSIIPGATDARYDGRGHLIYGTRDGTSAVGFDASNQRIVGEPIEITDPIAVSTLGAVNLGVATNGTLVYVPKGKANPVREMVFVDRDGLESPVSAPPRGYMSPRLSPDQTRIVVNSYDDDQDLWMWEIARKTLTRLTFDRALDYAPVWTADSRAVVFTSTRTGAGNLYAHAADGTGSDVRVTATPNTQIASAIGPDGHSILAYENRAATAYDLIRVPFAGTTPAAIGPIEPLLEKPGRQHNPIVSPDGRYLAYESDESGRFEIYVQPYSNLDGGRWQVSNDGGTQPAWTRGGRELVYLDAGNRLTSVGTDTTGGTFTHKSPATLLTTSYSTPELYRSYDVSPDGQRFLMLRESTAGSAPATVTVIQQWQQQFGGVTR